MKGSHFLSASALLASAYLAIGCQSPSPGPTYSLAGSASGFAGSSPTLTIKNTIDNTSYTFTGEGDFTLSTNLLSGYQYNLEFEPGPSAYQCSIENNAGVIQSANVDNIVVSCIAPIDPCASYGNTLLEITPNIRACNQKMGWGEWDSNLIYQGWQVCDLAQWAQLAPPQTPSDFNLGNMWINNSDCNDQLGEPAHREIWEFASMNSANCYNGTACCAADASQYQIALCKN